MAENMLTDSASVTTQMQTKPHFTDNPTPKIEQPQMHTEYLEEQKNIAKHQRALTWQQ
jgi:hypothetical protein